MKFVWTIDASDNHVLETIRGTYRVTPVPLNDGRVRYCASAPDHSSLGSVMDDAAGARAICENHFLTNRGR